MEVIMKFFFSILFFNLLLINHSFSSTETLTAAATNFLDLFNELNSKSHNGNICYENISALIPIKVVRTLKTIKDNDKSKEKLINNFAESFACTRGKVEDQKEQKSQERFLSSEDLFQLVNKNIKLEDNIVNSGSVADGGDFKECQGIEIGAVSAPTCIKCFNVTKIKEALQLTKKKYEEQYEKSQLKFSSDDFQSEDAEFDSIKGCTKTSLIVGKDVSVGDIFLKEIKGRELVRKTLKKSFDLLSSKGSAFFLNTLEMSDIKSILNKETSRLKIAEARFQNTTNLAMKIGFDVQYILSKCSVGILLTKK